MQKIYKITGITVQALQGSPLSHFNVNKQMSQAERCETKHEEDTAYSLLGIFDIYMPLIYDEGQKKAVNQFQKEIRESLLNEFKNLSLSPSFNIPFLHDLDYIN